MQLAKVIGTVVAVCKDELLTGIKLLVIQPVDSEKKYRFTHCCCGYNWRRFRGAGLLCEE